MTTEEGEPPMHDDDDEGMEMEPKEPLWGVVLFYTVVAVAAVAVVAAIVKAGFS